MGSVALPLRVPAHCQGEARPLLGRWTALDRSSPCYFLIDVRVLFDQATRWQSLVQCGPGERARFVGGGSFGPEESAVTIFLAPRSSA